MDLKYPLSSNADKLSFDVLLSALSTISPLVPRIESAVRVNIFADVHTRELDDLPLLERYFRYYTVPLLEGLGVVSERRHEDALFWGSVQVCMGLHLRYMDYLLDGDRPDFGNAYLAGRSAEYFFVAQKMLAERNLKWGVSQWAHYRQCFDFETEVSAGYVHGPMSLWRRVSPLCVIGATYCHSELGVQFVSLYHQFLGWCLLKGDYHDWLCDLNGGRRTCITYMMRDSGGSYPSHSHIRGVLDHVRKVLEIGHQQLVDTISRERYPLWHSVLRFVADVTEA
jgi:hypothetical protein